MTMRWFTRQHYEDPNFTDWDAVINGYWTYIQSIRSKLPHDLQPLAAPDGINLHDALIDLIETDFERRVAHIRFLTGDRTQFVDCRYDDADFGESNLRNLEFAVEAVIPRRNASGKLLSWEPIGTVLYDEISVIGDRFQHAFVIDPMGDFTVTFGNFSLSLERSSDGLLSERNERFVRIDEEAGSGQI